MDRRDFLKSIGLGAAVLTLPQPLEVIAAKVADLEAPPLHVGYGSLPCKKETPPISSIDFELVDRLSPDRIRDLFQSWVFHVIIQRPPHGWLPILECPTDKLIHEYPGRPFVMLPGAMINLQDTDQFEIWVAPRGTPRFVLPKLTARVYGSSIGMRIEGVRTFVWTVPIHHARVDRARAIELGLVSPSPEKEALIKSIPANERKGLVL